MHRLACSWTSIPFCLLAGTQEEPAALQRLERLRSAIPWSTLPEAAFAAAEGSDPYGGLDGRDRCCTPCLGNPLAGPCPWPEQLQFDTGAPKPRDWDVLGLGCVAAAMEVGGLKLWCGASKP